MANRVATLRLVVCVTLAFGSVIPVSSARLIDSLYWTIFTGAEYDGVYRANADGSGRQQIVSATINSLDGLAIDSVDNRLYIGTSYDLLSCNLDGSDLTTVIAGGTAFNFFSLAVDEVDRRIYWSDWIQDGSTPRIRRANLDGTSVETVFEGTLSYQKDIDSAAGHLYWTTPNMIYRSDLDGSNRTDILANTFDQMQLSGLVLDVPNDTIFFSTWGGGIWRANMDGSSVEQLGNDRTISLELDSEGGQLYWTSWAMGEEDIRRSNLDGTGEEQVVLMGGHGNSLAIGFIPEPTTLSLLLLAGLGLLRRRRG